MFDLTRIPPEIWQDILRSACTDGGVTGRSLALTSRFFLVQSSSMRYYSLLFDSLQRLVDFLEYWEDKMNDFPPGIHHLYLSFHDEPTVRSLSTWDAYRVKYQATLGTEQHYSGTFSLALRTLLKHVASSLRTLCVVLPNVGVVDLRPIFSGLCLHRLEELTLLGRINEDVSLSQSLQKDLPSVERLHCICTEDGEWDLTMANAVVPSYVHDLPSLTHLRISHIRSVGSLSIASDLARALGVPSNAIQADEASTHAGRSSSSRLRHVVLQCIQPYVPLWAPPPMVGLPKSVWDLCLLADQCEEIDGIRMLVVTRPWTGYIWTDPLWNALWAHQLRVDWSDRMEGGIGCWVETEEQDRAWMKTLHKLIATVAFGFLFCRIDSCLRNTSA
ncbi:hypothetical protein FKP32DRAFT_550422 [Trametes sanguinea]|nr:hypothetical protein FKP32DRAFT_550422 [Trametes sanguinea]